jgi:hypothetical protein
MAIAPVALLFALAQAPVEMAPPPPPVVGAPAPMAPVGDVRVRLQTSHSGLRLVESESRRAVCLLDCNREFLVSSVLRYDLADGEDRSELSDLQFPPSATRLVLDYKGRLTGLFAGGIVAAAIGIASLAVGLLMLLVGGLAAGLGSRRSGEQLALYSLPFLGGGVAVLVPGILMIVFGAKKRWEIIPDQLEFAPVPAAPPT